MDDSSSNNRSGLGAGVADNSSILAPGGRKTHLNGIFLGVIRDNYDEQKMGRLRVYIPDLGGDPGNDKNWYTVSYGTPFGGSTNLDSNVKSGPPSEEYAGSQQSYGWWAVPPDINNEVLVCFLNGDPTRGVWFACLYQQYMNHSIPAFASNDSFRDGENGVKPPVTEYNRLSDLEPPDPKRPRFEPLHEALREQGIYADQVKGVTDSSARRESPSRIFGLKSPRGHHIYIDDGKVDSTNKKQPSSKTAPSAQSVGDPTGPEFIRMRTRNGVQFMMNDTEGYIYMISRKGKSWLELNDQGISSYTNSQTASRSQGTSSHRIDGSRVTEVTEKQSNKVSSDITVNTGASMHHRSDGAGHFHAKGGVEIKSNSTLAMSSSSVMAIKGNSVHIWGPKIYLNTVEPRDAKDANELQSRTIQDSYPTKDGEQTGTIVKNISQSGDLGEENFIGEKRQGSSILPQRGFVTHSPWEGQPPNNNQDVDIKRQGDICSQKPFSVQGLGNGRNKQVEGSGNNRHGIYGKPHGNDPPGSPGLSNSTRSNRNRRNPGGNQENQDTAWDRLKEKGYTDAQAAGIMGNLHEESGGLNNNVIDGSRRGDAGTANGVAQWRGIRFEGLQDFASRNGTDWRDLNTQIDYVDAELKGTLPSRYRDRGAENAWRQMQQNPDDAAANARIFDKYYERSDGNAREYRAKHAEDYQNKYQGKKPGEKSQNKGGQASVAGLYHKPIKVGEAKRRNGSNGYWPNYNQRRGNRSHEGIDITCPTGTNVYAMTGGTVSVSKFLRGYGNTVIITHDVNGPGGKPLVTLYAHNSSLSVGVGEKVKAAQVIAKSGNTGASTGPHLHFEVREKGRPVTDGIRTPAAQARAASWGGTWDPYKFIGQISSGDTNGYKTPKRTEFGGEGQELPQQGENQ